MGESGQLRMRVFAGPNGSGKSTVIKYIRTYKVNGKDVQFGYYINADDIAHALKNRAGFSCHQFDILLNQSEFVEIADHSGLLNNEFKKVDFESSFEIKDNAFRCKKKEYIDRFAQIIADFLRKKLLKEGKRFSFETVFSHSSKLDIMRQAVEAGYKVYLYFVSTEFPEINKFRVKARMTKGGHYVPEEKIVERYFRAMNFMHEAAQLAYQAYFFDNSDDEKESRLFAHFKVIGGKKVWDEINELDVPDWFKTYYSAKVTS